ITHIKRLKGVKALVTRFFAVAEALKKGLGPVLFQLPPNFKKDIPRLHNFLGTLPPRRRVAFEFRHHSWFDDAVFALLRRHKSALCIADAEGDLEVPFEATADWGYLRLRQPEYDDAALRSWLSRIRTQHWRDVFVFFKHEDESKGPRFAKRL